MQDSTMQVSAASLFGVCHPLRIYLSYLNIYRLEEKISFLLSIPRKHGHIFALFEAVLTKSNERFGLAV